MHSMHTCCAASTLERHKQTSKKTQWLCLESMPPGGLFTLKIYYTIPLWSRTEILIKLHPRVTFPHRCWVGTQNKTCAAGGCVLDACMDVDRWSQRRGSVECCIGVSMVRVKITPLFLSLRLPPPLLRASSTTAALYREVSQHSRRAAR